MAVSAVPHGTFIHLVKTKDQPQRSTREIDGCPARLIR